MSESWNVRCWMRMWPWRIMALCVSHISIKPGKGRKEGTWAIPIKLCPLPPNDNVLQTVDYPPITCTLLPAQRETLRNVEENIDSAKSRASCYSSSYVPLFPSLSVQEEWRTPGNEHFFAYHILRGRRCFLSIPIFPNWNIQSLRIGRIILNSFFRVIASVRMLSFSCLNSLQLDIPLGPLNLGFCFLKNPNV